MQLRHRRSRASSNAPLASETHEHEPKSKVTQDTQPTHNHHSAHAHKRGHVCFHFFRSRKSAFVFGLLLGTLCIIPFLFTSGEGSNLQRFVDTETFRLVLQNQLENVIGSDMMGNFTHFFTEKLIPLSVDGDTMSPGPGKRMAQKEGLKQKYPVFIIPGITSTSLESWSREGCGGESYFRKKIWGDVAMGTGFLMDKDCWIELLMLDPKTGLDPNSTKLRAAEGIDAAEYFVPGYWVWAKIIDNLSFLGYDSNSIHMQPYDWRLSPQGMESRDRFFSFLKANIELSKKTSGEKCVILTHSMGGNVLHYFLKWVESKKNGHVPGWVDEHVHAVVNIAAPYLGVAKTVPSLLSGEMRDTAHLGWAMSYLLERFLSRLERAKLFRSWPSIGSMLPKGGSAFWGSKDGSPDTVGVCCDGHLVSTQTRIGPLITLRSTDNDTVEVTGDNMHSFISNRTSDIFGRRLNEDFSWGIASDLRNTKYDNEKYWTNPLESELPRATSLTIYCLYGVGKPTERAYFYASGMQPSDPAETPLTTDETPMTVTLNHSTSAPVAEALGLFLDTDVNEEAKFVTSGVQDVDGDGTVSLLSLGYMCSHGWRHADQHARNPKKYHGSLFNPGRVKIVTREYKHEPMNSVRALRGGPYTADHVDILGNHLLTEDILRIVSGGQVSDRFYSQIQTFSDRVNMTQT